VHDPPCLHGGDGEIVPLLDPLEEHLVALPALRPVLVQVLAIHAGPSSFPPALG
jgi:hypothetical protein